MAESGGRVWTDAPGYPYIRRSGARYLCTACSKQGTGHQYPRHCTTVEHRNRVRALARAQLVLGSAPAHAVGGPVSAAAGGAAHSIGSLRHVNVCETAHAPAAAAAAAVRSFTPSPAAPAVVASSAEPVINGTRTLTRVCARARAL